MRDKYFVSTKAGKGAFGEVKLLFDVNNFERLVMKVLDKASSRTAEYQENEMQLLKAVDHKHIVQFHDRVG